MRKYDFVTGEFVEENVLCEFCGKVIDAAFGVKVYYEEEDGKKVQKYAGSCCVGRIQVSKVISKKAMDAYRTKGQIPEAVLKKLSKAPPPKNAPNRTAGKKAHKFIDVVGRSKKVKRKSVKKKIIKSA